jgi:hypothetical protein
LATTVYNIEEISLRDGTTVTLKPLPIKQLRKFMEIINKGQVAENENPDAALDIFIEACMLCLLTTERPELGTDRDKFEEVIETPTMMKILEIIGGLNLTDPNLLGAALVGTN